MGTTVYPVRIIRGTDATYEVGNELIIDGGTWSRSGKRVTLTLPAGGGDVTGDTSSTTGHLAVFSDGTGKAIEDSGVALSDLALDSDLAAEAVARAAADAALQPLDADLTAYAALTSTGVVVRTGSGTVTTRTASQTLSADGTMTADVGHLRVTAACVVTLPAVSSCTIGVSTVITVESTSEIIVQLAPNASDKIEGAALAGLIATRGAYILTPTVANKWSLAAVRGLAQWVHASYDLTTAAGASPWTIGGSTWTDISSASSSVVASSGLQATAKSSSAYFSVGTADCAVVRTPLSGVVDGWSRPLTAERTFWVLTKCSKTTSVGGSSPGVIVALAGSALSGTPRIGMDDNGATTTVSIKARDGSGSRTESSTTSSATAAGWLGVLWEGSSRRVGAGLRSTAPSGSPGAASGWWPRTYRFSEDFAVGQDYWGFRWDLVNLTDLHIAQANTTTGSKFTFTEFVLLAQIGSIG